MRLVAISGASGGSSKLLVRGMETAVIRRKGCSRGLEAKEWTVTPFGRVNLNLRVIILGAAPFGWLRLNTGTTRRTILDRQG